MCPLLRLEQYVCCTYVLSGIENNLDNRAITSIGRCDMQTLNQTNWLCPWCRFAAVKLNGGRHVQGILRGFDPFMNLVVDETLEMGPGGQQNSIGMVVSTTVP